MKPPINWDAPEILARLGKDSNAAIARDLKCSRERVRQAMAERKISRGQTGPLLTENLTVTISAEFDAYLRGRAAQLGRDPTELAREWLEVGQKIYLRRKNRRGRGG